MHVCMYIYVLTKLGVINLKLLGIQLNRIVPVSFGYIFYKTGGSAVASELLLKEVY